MQTGEKAFPIPNYAKAKFLCILIENLHDKKMLKCEKTGRRQSNKYVYYLVAEEIEKTGA